MNLLNKPLDEFTVRDQWTVVAWAAAAATVVVAIAIAGKSASPGGQGHVIVATIGMLFALRLLVWLISSGWWLWLLKVCGSLLAWVTAAALFGPVVGYIVAGVVLLIGAWPKLARRAAQIEAAQAAARERGERIDRVLRVFEDRING